MAGEKVKSGSQTWRQTAGDRVACGSHSAGSARRRRFAHAAGPPAPSTRPARPTRGAGTARSTGSSQGTARCRPCPGGFVGSGEAPAPHFDQAFGTGAGWRNHFAPRFPARGIGRKLSHDWRCWDGGREGESGSQTHCQAARGGIARAAIPPVRLTGGERAETGIKGKFKPASSGESPAPPIAPNPAEVKPAELPSLRPAGPSSPFPGLSPGKTMRVLVPAPGREVQSPPRRSRGAVRCCLRSWACW